jgi:hypothetical protein
VRQESYPVDPRRWDHGGIRVAISANQISVLNQVKGTSMDEIRIVQEFPDVFPEELPGMLPNRDIEFIIELLPGTPPISKRPYRMPMNN